MSISNQSEESGTPATPSAGRQLLYPKAAGWFTKNSAGVEEQITGIVNPAFAAHKNGTGQTGINASWTKLTWSTELFDTNSNFASDRFTPTVAGNYLITGTMGLIMLIGEQCYLALYKNGVLLKEGYTYVAANSVLVQTSLACIVQANGTTDYFELYATVVAGATREVLGDKYLTTFEGSRLG